MVTTRRTSRDEGPVAEFWVSCNKDGGNVTRGSGLAPLDKLDAMITEDDLPYLLQNAEDDTPEPDLSLKEWKELFRDPENVDVVEVGTAKGE